MSAEIISANGADVLVIGGGPAGLSFATTAAQQLHASVVVADRANYFGGTPQSTHHLGFGIRDLHQLRSGPSYATELHHRALRHGVDLRSGTNVLGWSPQLVAELSGHGQTSSLQTRAIVLATGVRERSRHSRLIAGDRGSGVYTTGSLQRLVYQLGIKVGTRAVIVGAEHVSFSAIQTLAHGGCTTVAMITSEEHDQTFPPLRWWLATRRRIPIVCRDSVTLIHGNQRVSGVTLASGRQIECDTVIFTGDWAPENDLARLAGLELCAESKAPEVDSFGRTRQPGVFAIGNVAHPSEPADVCALNARRSVDGLQTWLNDGFWPHDLLAIRTSEPISSTWPSLISSLDHESTMLLRVSTFVAPHSQITIEQAGGIIWKSDRKRTMVTNRSITLPLHWAKNVDPRNGDLDMRIVNEV